MSAFYEHLGDGRFRITEHARGPWNPEHQHAGPPAALLGRGAGIARSTLSDDAGVVGAGAQALLVMPR